MLRNIINANEMTFINRWSLKPPVKLYSDIEAREVFSPCDCVVIYVGRDRDSYYNVLLQICADVVVNLKHLINIQVEVGQLVKERTFIGVAKKFCRVELGTLSKDEVDECIRIYDKMYYKRNPEQLTAENLGFVQFNHGDTEYAYKDKELSFIDKFSKEQDLEYSQIEVQVADE